MSCLRRSGRAGEWLDSPCADVWSAAEGTGHHCGMRYSGHPTNSSRTVFDIAVGVLVGRRGCSPEDAFNELVSVVSKSGIGIGSLAGALVALASGNSGSSTDDAEAFSVWGQFLSPTTKSPSRAK